jgi:methylenetetrahydrofolate--tRNA-(uracil-5-)-methyltransferase
LAGRFAAAQARGGTVAPPPATTALGALLTHITKGADAQTFQPMNVNFGLFPPLETEVRGRDRKKLMAHRALTDLDAWLGRPRVAAE